MFHFANCLLDLYCPLSLHAVSLFSHWLWQELMQKEVEYVSLSRDTTESDLKQRREIKDGTAEYIHQVHVCARMRVHAFGSVCSVGVHNCDCMFMCLYIFTYVLYWFLPYVDRTSHCGFEVSHFYSSFSPVMRIKTLSCPFPLHSPFPSTSSSFHLSPPLLFPSLPLLPALSPPFSCRVL